MNSKVLIGIIVISVIVGAVFLLGSNKKTQEQTPTSNNNNIPTSTEESQPMQEGETVNIEVTSSGFSPASINVKLGTKVVWNNKSGADISINSDDHPTHRLYNQLNLGHIPDSSSVSLLFDKPGTYTYHDHYKPESTGTIIVK